MNKIFKYIGSVLACVLAVTACSPEEFTGADQNGLPTVDGRQVSVTTDQETNTAVFTVSGDFKGCYPVWYLDGKIYSFLATGSYSSMEQGTHELEVKVINRNGISQASAKGSFTFNETKVDFTPYFSKLCNKEWRVDYTEVGHMGCGPSGTDGSEWWKAAVNDKADWGVYDDRISFAHSDSDPATGGTYSYNPGEGGTVYVNTGSSVFAEFNTNDGNDFMATVAPQTSSYTLVPGTFNDEACLYIQFAPQTLLPYIPNDATYNNPYYRIEALTNTRMVLVCDEGSIAWRLVFTSREDTGLPEPGDEAGATMDWNYDAASNLWKGVDTGDNFDKVSPWFANNDWAQIADPEWKHEGDTWQITMPEGIGSSQWQGQFPIHTKLSASMNKRYNFYCVVESDNDMPGLTIKLTETGDDNNFFFADRHEVTADKAFVYKAENVSLPLKDAAALSLFLDFGGTPAGTVVKVSKIYFEEALSYDDERNMWKSVDSGESFIEVAPWFANDGWGQIDNPKWSHDGNVWELDIPAEIGTQQWQGQFPIKTSLSASMADSYTFSCTVEGDNDMPGVTIKLTDGADDNNFFVADRHQIIADKPFTYKVTGVKLPVGDAASLSLFFDFGGTPGGTHVKISDIILIKE
ncbi:hypothetical protein [Prevotella sp. P3-122]|uniref:hypothetical protein n=1 Tax=Prevotella sp. P3-122 TaxID=2024223 RepID=UPI000B9761B1|nr:hypothetical protein [Prevotella sp. P3-122]OYP61670.1 hypothetical protein CIL02_05410 [Prevotella sp. P3-122]